MNTFNLTQKFLHQTVWLLVFSLTILLSSCGEDDGPTPLPTPTGDSKTYTLAAVSDPAISGTAKFEELEGGSTLVTLMLSGTSGSAMHPAHIHMNSAAIGGDITISLNPVDAATGKSETQCCRNQVEPVLNHRFLLLSRTLMFFVTSAERLSPPVTTCYKSLI